LKAITKKRFSKVYIEISNLCNLQCSFCPEVQRDKKILAVEDFKKIIDGVAPFTDRVTLHLMGEPLLHPQFTEILSLVNDSSLEVDLTTNAILLKKHQDLLIQAKAIRQINFSLQSYMDNFPGKSLENYLAPIFQFTESVQSLRPELFINFRLWNLEESQSNLAEALESKIAIPENLLNLLNVFSKTFKKELPDFVDVRAKKSWKLTDKIRIHWDTRFEWPSLDQPVSDIKGFCYGLKSQLGIHADGTVVPCCLDKEAKINLGNILHSPLNEILDGTRAQSMLKNFAKGIACEELCQKCTFKSRFQNKIKKKLNLRLD
jgi:radical SAM protein with 4Fe4S-binding SPASM domain